MAKLLIHPRDVKFTPKLKRQLCDAGYILVPEEQAGSVRVVEPLPDLSLDDNETLWLIRTLLDLVLSDSFSSLKEKLGKKLIERLKAKVADVEKKDNVVPIIEPKAATGGGQ